MGLHCGAYYSNCAVIGHFTCQTAYLTGSDRMSHCNQTLFLSGRVGSGDETSTCNNQQPHPLSKLIHVYSHCI